VLLRAVQGGRDGGHRARQSAAVRAGFLKRGRHVAAARAAMEAATTSRRSTEGSAGLLTPRAWRAAVTPAVAMASW
jgi:hypothetical protein